MFEAAAMERTIKDYFGVNADIRQWVLEKVSVGKNIDACLFLTSKKQLFLLINGSSDLVLGDIRKIVSHMGLKAEIYFPPRNRLHYFDEIGREKFHEVFPSRKQISSDDIVFYRTLAPYNPALMLISEIKDSFVYCYDANAKNNWRPAVRFAYRRIKTS